MSGTGPQILNRGTSVKLDANGNGTAQIGPDQGPATWNIDTLLWSTNNPGKTPIPIIQVYLDNPGDPSSLQCQDYDGSLGSADGNLTINRGSHLFAVFTGGPLNGTAFLTVAGTMHS